MPSGLNATLIILCLLELGRSLPSSLSRSDPSCAEHRWAGAAEWIYSDAEHVPLARSHTSAPLLRLPVTKRVPSGLNATLHESLASNVAVQPPLARSHTLMLSLLHVAKHEPSGLNATPVGSGSSLSNLGVGVQVLLARLHIMISPVSQLPVAKRAPSGLNATLAESHHASVSMHAPLAMSHTLV
eukprot:354551-Chlamydomonas_euryale.AAC.4